MRRKKRALKVFAFIVIISVVSFGTVCFAQDKNAKAETKVLKLTLEDAIKISEQNNPQIKLSKLELEKAQFAKKQLEYTDKKAQKNAFGTSNFEYKYAMELGKKRADFAVKMGEKGIDATLRNIRFGVEATYYAALSARDNMQILENALERQNDILRISEAKYKVGVDTKKDVLDAQVQVTKAKTAVLQARAEKEKAYINLKKLLGLHMNQELELTDEFDYKPLTEEIQLDELIKKARQNRIDIISAEGLYEIAQLDFDLTSKAYPSTTFNYKQKEFEVEEARMKAEDAISSAEAEIRQIVLDLHQAEANIPLLDKTIEFAEESFRLAKLSYDTGILRSVDVAAAEEGLKQAELQRAQVIYAYNLMRMKIENAAFIPVSTAAR